VELYGRVRRAVFVEGKNRRAVAREFGIARKTVNKMLRYPAAGGGGDCVLGADVSEPVSHSTGCRCRCAQ
jgi:hypothetical protein